MSYLRTEENHLNPSFLHCFLGELIGTSQVLSLFVGPFLFADLTQQQQLQAFVFLLKLLVEKEAPSGETDSCETPRCVDSSIAILKTVSCKLNILRVRCLSFLSEFSSCAYCRFSAMKIFLNKNGILLDFQNFPEL